jgi:hypothetical protein
MIDRKRNWVSLQSTKTPWSKDPPHQETEQKGNNLSEITVKNRRKKSNMTIERARTTILTSSSCHDILIYQDPY